MYALNGDYCVPLFGIVYHSSKINIRTRGFGADWDHALGPSPKELRFIIL